MNISRRFYLLLASCGFAIACACHAFAGEIPKAVWRPGNYPNAEYVRMSSDSKYVTMLSEWQTLVIRLETNTCVLVIDHLVSQFDLEYYNRRPSYTSVSESGNTLVVVDTTGSVSWYNVGDSLPFLEQMLDSGLYREVHLLNDSVGIVTRSQDSVQVFSQGGSHSRRAPACRKIEDWERLDNWLSDTLAVLRFDSTSAMLDTRTGDTIVWIPGNVLGYAPDGNIVVHSNDSVQIYDIRSWSIARTVAINCRYAGDIAPCCKVGAMHSRFVNIIRRIAETNVSGVLDLLDGTIRPSSGAVYDVSLDRTQLAHDHYRCQMTLTSSNGSVVVYPILDGPMVAVVQHPRDSTIYASTEANITPISYGPIGNMVSIKNASTHIHGSHPHINQLSPFRKIRDTLVTVYFGGEYDVFQGYLNFDSEISSSGYVRSGIHLNHFDFSERGLFNRFSEHGDTLTTRDTKFEAGDCEHADPAIQPRSAAAGFITGTPFYIVSNVRYDFNQCDDSLRLPYHVFAIATERDRIASRSGDTVFLSSAADPDARYASIISNTVRPSWWWSDSGYTLRYVENRNTIVSLYSDGTIKRLHVPDAFNRNAGSKWTPSHDGNIVTCRSRDTIVTIDIPTGAMLREYYGAPWLQGRAANLRTWCHVADIDGSIVVSLPGGCYTTFPGVTRPVLNSTEIHSPLRPLQLHGTGIEGATPLSTITVYSVLGALVIQDNADDNGGFELDDKGLPHGAYVVVYGTARGMQTGRVLL